MLVADVDLIRSLGRGVMYDLDLILPAIGVLSIEEFEGVRPLPLVTGEDVFLGVDDPKPTGVGLYGGRPTPLPPDLMLEVRRTPEPLASSS